MEPTVSSIASLTAQVVCICLLARRPAKSSSKKLRLWPRVCLCSRHSRRVPTFGPIARLIIALWKACASGLASPNTNAAPIKGHRFSARNFSRPLSAAISTSVPRYHAAQTSKNPKITVPREKSRTIQRNSHNAQRKNSPSAFGGTGSPSAWNGGNTFSKG